jgi:hypothetical protein
MWLMLKLNRLRRFRPNLLLLSPRIPNPKITSLFVSDFALSFCYLLFLVAQLFLFKLFKSWLLFSFLIGTLHLILLQMGAEIVVQGRNLLIMTTSETCVFIIDKQLMSIDKLK